MPYNTNDPNYQTKNSRVANFNDFNSNIQKEKDELEKVDKSFINNDSEMHQMPGNTKKKFNRVTRKLDDLSRAEVKDKLQAIEDMGEEKPKHKWKAEIPTQQSSKNENVETGDQPDNYMFFNNLKTINKLSSEILNMDQSEIDEVLNEADWASDHIATSKDDIEEVFNFLSMLKDRREYTIWQKSHGKKPSDFKSTLVDQEFEKFSNKKRK